MKKKMLLFAVLALVVSAGSVVAQERAAPARPPAAPGLACNDIACIGGDWWTDLILTVNNYHETFRKLKWNPFRAQTSLPPMAAIAPINLFAGLEGAGWWWNTANTLHNFTSGPWDLQLGPVGYCHNCGGWYRSPHS